MPTNCIDVSNYSSPLTADLLRGWMADGVRLVLIQAFPPDYVQYAEQRDQMRLCAEVGLTFDVYVYDYLGDPTWLGGVAGARGALEGLAQAEAEEGVRPRKLWLDEEDVETERGWRQQQRIDAISESIDRAGARGSVGIYTGEWWWRPKTGNLNGFAGVPLWAAQYDGDADASVFTPFGGWITCRIKQFRGTSAFDGVSGVDLNVLSAEEEAELSHSASTNCDETVAPFKAAIDHAVQRLWLELKKRSLAKKPIKEIADELYAALQA